MRLLLLRDEFKKTVMNPTRAYRYIRIDIFRKVYIILENTTLTCELVSSWSKTEI
jgi:hypothetical protein